MYFTKLREEVEHWEDEGVFHPPVRPQLPRLCVESVPAEEVVKEERNEEETCIDGMTDNLTLIVRPPSPITPI